MDKVPAATLQAIEREILARAVREFGVRSDLLLYDTTNFFTYLEADNPSRLARTGHNKDSHHHLRQIGLALAMDRISGIPFFHRAYQGNRQDAHVFSGIVKQLTECIAGAFKQVQEVVLLLDKGNNSKKNFDALAETMQWVGSLVPSNYRDLLLVPVADYPEEANGLRMLRAERKVMGRLCTLVMTYNPSLARKQEYSLQLRIAKIIANLEQRRDSYHTPPTVMTQGLKSILANSRHKKFVRVRESSAGLRFEIDSVVLETSRQRMGKNLIFTSKLDAPSEWIARQYKERVRIENCFKTLKCPGIISLRPIRHWTDTKIRAYVFCCVMSFMLLSWMLHRIDKEGLGMSPAMLREELAGLEEILWLYSDGKSEQTITQASSVQKKLACIFNLNIE